MVGQNGKFLDNPLLLVALLPDQGIQVVSHITHQHFFASFGAENEMVHDPVHTMLVMLISCISHVFIIQPINKYFNLSFLLDGRRTHCVRAKAFLA